MKLWAVHFKAAGEHKSRVFSDHEVIVEADTNEKAVTVALDRFSKDNPFATTPLVTGTPKPFELESIYIYNHDLWRIVKTGLRVATATEPNNFRSMSAKEYDERCKTDPEFEKQMDNLKREN